MLENFTNRAHCTQSESCSDRFDRSLTEYYTSIVLQNLNTAIMGKYSLYKDEQRKVTSSNYAAYIQLMKRERIELFATYVSAVKYQDITVENIRIVTSFIVKCLKHFPNSLEPFPIISKEAELDGKLMLQDISLSHYDQSYDICLAQYVSFKINHKFCKNKELIRIWHKVIRQMFQD